MTMQNEDKCKNTLDQCESFCKIKSILQQYDNFISNKQKRIAYEEHCTIQELVNKNSFGCNYSDTKLLNDFFHIKYNHQVHDEPLQFDKCHQFLTNSPNSLKCDINNCPSIKRHYQHHDGYDSSINLLSRIHTYFTHSYETSKLTLDEIKYIEQQVNDETTCTDEERNNDQILMLTANIVMQKKNALSTVVRIDNRKFITSYHKDIDCEKISDILKHYDILIHYNKLQFAFDKHCYNKPNLIDDLCDAYTHANDEQFLLSHILVNEFNVEQSSTRKKIYNLLLYKYIKLNELNCSNFIKIFRKIISKPSSGCCDVNKCIEIAKKHHLSGQVFMSKNSVKFAKLFESIKNYNKKHWTKIYNTIKKWENKSYTQKHVDEEEEKYPIYTQKHDNKEEEYPCDQPTRCEKPLNFLDTYGSGIPLWYWNKQNCTTKDRIFVKKKYDTLKTEILNSDILTKKQWDALEQNCAILINIDKVKQITANGNDVSIYGIKDNDPFTLKHVYAMKLYTDYTNLCLTFCNTFRLKRFSATTYETIDSLKNRNKLFANMARLLVECVQCYGTLLRRQSSYYRGINVPFIFNKFVTRFHVPLSTVTEFTKAVVSNGLVIELSNSDCATTVFSFNCCYISIFDDETEVLFFGGNTVLQMSSIYQMLNHNWTSYRDYVKAIKEFRNIMNGFTGSCNRTNKLMDIIKCMMEHKSVSNTLLPPYIAKLLWYQSQTIPKQIDVDWDEFLRNIVKYKGLKEIFTKHNGNMLNISNLCKLLINCNHFHITMPHSVAIDNTLCESLLCDVSNITNNDINLQLEWSLVIQESEKQLIKQHFINHKKVNVKFTNTSITITKQLNNNNNNTGLSKANPINKRERKEKANPINKSERKQSDLQSKASVTAPKANPMNKRERKESDLQPMSHKQNSNDYNINEPLLKHNHQDMAKTSLTKPRVLRSKPVIKDDTVVVNRSFSKYNQLPIPESETSQSIISTQIPLLTSLSLSEFNSKQKSYRESFLRMFNELMNRTERRSCYFICFLIACTAALTLIFFICVARIIDLLANTKNNARRLFLLANIYDGNNLQKLMITIIIISIAALVFRYVQSLLTSFCVSSFLKRLNCQTFEKIIHQNLSFFDMRNKRDLRYLLTNDMKHIRKFLHNSVTIMESFVHLLWGIIYVFVINWDIALIMCGSFTILTIISLLHIKKSNALYKIRKKSFGYVIASVVEMLSYITTIKTFSKEDDESFIYEMCFERAFVNDGKKHNLSHAYRFWMSMMIYFTIVAIIMYGSLGILVVEDMTVGILVVDLFILIHINVCIYQIVNSLPVLVKGGESLIKILDILDIENFDKIKHNYSNKYKINGKIEIKNISFAYPKHPSKQVLNNISLTFLPSSITALVGRNGSGKSTIFKLLMRFFEFYEGEILIDGIDIKDYNLPFLLSQIGYISENVKLFDNQTIGDNIKFGMKLDRKHHYLFDVEYFDEESMYFCRMFKNITQMDVEKASKLANAHEFIMKLENGYDTIIGGEYGTKLSHGQKQRIGIARALLLNPKLILFDEAFSGIDSISKHLIMESLDNIIIGRCVIVIAHRLKTVQNANYVYAFNDGKVVGEGTHDELMNSDNKLYVELINKLRID